MLDSDDVVSKCLFDAVRDAEQSYVAYCVVYLYHTHGKAAELFKHALERDFDTGALKSFAVVSCGSCSLEGARLVLT